MSGSLLTALLAFSAFVLAFPSPAVPERLPARAVSSFIPVAAASSYAPAAAAASSAPAAAVSYAPAAVAYSVTTGTCSLDSSLPGSQNVGTGSGQQFITGQCYSKADCASACCVGQSDGVALCKAAIVTEEAGLSCDFFCSSISSASAAPFAAASSSASYY